MKKIIYAVIAVVFVSCNGPFFSEPVIPNDSQNRSGSPENVSASQGEKRTITLSWNLMTSAALYYVYSAASPLDVFVRCGETSSNQISFNVQPGSTVYYRVSSVSHDGKESSQGKYVRGTSLAQPVITDITDITESYAAVTWYMDNVSGDTYQNNLLYTVYCFNGTIEVAQLALEGSAISENKAVFTSLNANTRYEYQVEAYLRSDQNASEKSERMDAATARRFRPGPPEKMKVARGTAVNKIEISFELPDMVDIALGENLYDPKPLYFVISKRRYSANNSNEYLVVCSYFGSDGTKAGGISNGKQFNDYIYGAVVKWEDTNNISRGVEYEYLVQSYVDGTPRTISSDASKASAAGWALSEGNLSLMDVEYEYEPSGVLFGSATLPLDFEFDPKGIAYDYTLVETIEPLGDGWSLDPDTQITNKFPFISHDAIRSYLPTMNLTLKTDQSNSGRGLYSYVVEIRMEGSAPESTPLDVVEAIGQKEISEDTQPLVVEQFRVQDGFTDKFILRWYYWSNRKYIIYESLNRNGPWLEIATINGNPDDDDNMSGNENYEWSYAGQATGAVKYFAVEPYREVGGDELKRGQKVYATAASRTLGVPKVSQGGDGHSYSTITALWTETQKADTYRIKYWYTEEGNYQSAIVAKTVNASELSLDASGQYKYTFSPFATSGNVVEVSKAGKEIQIAVDALNEGLRATVGGGEIGTTSAEEVKLRLVGPALLNLSASKAVSTSEITVSWNKITGADGYYVFRRQFNMNNTAEDGIEAVVYYVPALQADSLTGKNLLVDASNAKSDTLTVKASASLSGSIYQLKDIYLPDNDYNGTLYGKHTPEYRDQQNNLAQGYPYRYYVVPVVNRGGAPEPLTSIDFTYGKDGLNKNTNITSYTIRENNISIGYSGAAGIEQEGFVIGFGQNVVATKGTYASSGNVNDGIKITWNLPPRLSTVAGFTPRYTLYRRASGSSTWDTVTTVNAPEHADTPQTRGVAYEYVIGISNGGTASQPHSSTRFIELCYTLQDEKHRPNMLGFMLGTVRMDKVSRNEIKVGNDFAEEVEWFSAGITNSASQDPNWGIDGYTVFVMNRNNNTNWHEIADLTNILNQTNQSIIVANNSLLKVLREYRHYFKVRSYVLRSGGERIYGPDHSTSWSDSFNNNDNTDVKWGARQISTDEFAAITSLSIGTGMNQRSANNVSLSESNVGYNRDIKFSNSRPHIVTVNGTLHGYCEAAAKTPAQYGAYCAGAWGALSGAKDQQSTLAITGPDDVNGMYSGTVRILRLGSGAGAGPYRVDYNGQNNIAVEAKHYRECFTFNVASNNYKSTSGLNWKPDTGWW